MCHQRERKHPFAFVPRCFVDETIEEECLYKPLTEIQKNMLALPPRCMPALMISSPSFSKAREPFAPLSTPPSVLTTLEELEKFAFIYEKSRRKH